MAEDWSEFELTLSSTRQEGRKGAKQKRGRRSWARSNTGFCWKSGLCYFRVFGFPFFVSGSQWFSRASKSRLPQGVEERSQAPKWPTTLTLPPHGGALALAPRFRASKSGSSGGVEKRSQARRGPTTFTLAPREGASARAPRFRASKSGLSGGVDGGRLRPRVGGLPQAGAARLPWGADYTHASAARRRIVLRA